MITLRVDGAFRPKTKEGGIGIEITTHKKRHLKKFYIPQVFDNHQLEFLALYYGITEVLKLFPEPQVVHIQSDSQVVVDSVDKGFIANDKYKPYLQVVMEDLKHINLYMIDWTSESDNKFVDQLAKQALNKAGDYEVIEG